MEIQVRRQHPEVERDEPPGVPYRDMPVAEMLAPTMPFFDIVVAVLWRRLGELLHPWLLKQGHLCLTVTLSTYHALRGNLP